MPLELAPAGVDEDFVVAAAPDGVEDCADGFAADVDEPEGLEPHAATPNADNSSRTVAKRRGDLFIVAFMNCSSVRCRRIVASRLRSLVDAREQRAVVRWTDLYASGPRVRPRRDRAGTVG
jgi:hypothetical protein